MRLDFGQILDFFFFFFFFSNGYEPNLKKKKKKKKKHWRYFPISLGIRESFCEIAACVRGLTLYSNSVTAMHCTLNCMYYNVNENKEASYGKP